MKPLRRSSINDTVLPVNYTMPAFTSQAFTRWRHHWLLLKASNCSKEWRREGFVRGGIQLKRMWAHAPPSAVWRLYLSSAVCTLAAGAIHTSSLRAVISQHEKLPDQLWAAARTRECVWSWLGGWFMWDQLTTRFALLSDSASLSLASRLVSVTPWGTVNILQVCRWVQWCSGGVSDS